MGSDIQRYSLGSGWCPSEDDSGRYVEFSDHTEIVSRLTRRLEAAEKVVMDAQAVVESKRLAESLFLTERDMAPRSMKQAMARLVESVAAYDSTKEAP